MIKPALALLLLAAPAFASGFTPSRPDEEVTAAAPMEGLYAAAGAGPALLITNAGNALALDAELRLGYSFNPGMQIYLAGSTDSGSISGQTVRLNTVAAYLQYHLHVGRSVLVYSRAGIGLGFGPLSINAPNDTTGLGLAAAGGLGLEIRLTPSILIGPELFYRNGSIKSGQYGLDLQVIGLQLGIFYY